MDEAHQVVIQALKEAGLSLPAGSESLQDLFSPAVLVAICSRAVALIHGASAALPPPFFPASMSDRIRLCNDLAVSIKDLRFEGDLSFHQFLYPSEEETHQLFRFLLEKIPGVSKIREGNGLEHKLRTLSSDELSASKDGDMSKREEQLNILSLENLKLTEEISELSQRLANLEGECEASSKRLEELRKQKTCLEMGVNSLSDSIPIEESLSILRLGNQGEESKNYLIDSSMEGEAISSEPRNQETLEGSGPFMKNDDICLKQQELENVRQQAKDIIARIRQRNEQNSLLAQELDKRTKVSSRSSYMKRIRELIKNSKKQDTDISHIIAETRELHRESNANQERLKRTYAIVDELVFRDAKKDATSRQAYRLLTSIHDNFAECSDKIFTLDKLHREITELASTVEAMEKRPVDLHRAEADFSTLVSENACLERAIQANSKNSG
ncbi:hypothetical protein KP509_33G016700 [Ceratopteris richardii]|uniref:Coiled-coil domain-containing protein 22 homolog n=3 Tax=Ceratopteris richardii TaxID=49495 RepID=A0A8T2QN12_CERRI|nr:hypothetical protein KP509_33G016700 [Ceratopteris richardii]